MTDTSLSSFIVEEDKLTDEEIEKLISFSQCALNATEKWEIQFMPHHKVVNGVCFGIDSGIFYLWLIEEKLDQKIEIIRG